MAHTGKGFWKVLNWVTFWRATCYFQSLPSQREACLPQDCPLPSPYSSLPPPPSPPYLWTFFVTGRSSKSHLVTAVLHFSFQIIVWGNQKHSSQYQEGTFLITKTSFSLTKPSWNHSASPHSHTNFPHCQRGYSPLSGIHPLLCQGKKPICPVTLKGRVIYRETHCIRKSFCNIICNLLERPRHSYTEQGTHLFTSVKGTVFRTSGYATLLVITQGHQSKITILLFFFSR